MKINKIANSSQGETIPEHGRCKKEELEDFGAVKWSVFMDGDLVVVSIYKKGGLQIEEVLQRLIGEPNDELPMEPN